MLVYRIAKTQERCKDISGFGAFRYGGRWNSVGTYMLYTSENSSLAYLENLVHFDSDNVPPELFIITLEIELPATKIKELGSEEYPVNWQSIGCLDIKTIGDEFVKSNKHLALKVRSAVNTTEHNYLLNPLFPSYHNLVDIKEIKVLTIDSRLIK